ncbi:lysozyme g isoform X2 [Alligator mississippiensis]|uniref:lysozyme g isoform X2 n=1 Tax=Alligator mississippiensis TaxID=8496 RepID=UPI000906F987|nr:lysozyme g isoform X2 [Alligator mississippiensis]
MILFHMAYSAKSVLHKFNFLFPHCNFQPLKRETQEQKSADHQATMSDPSEHYGKLMDVDTTGASIETGKQEGLSYGGVTASEKIAERDLKNLQKYETKIKNVGKKLGVDPALIAAIISRESHGGIVLKDGWGDGGNGFGLMQVDKRHHEIVGTWDSEEHITQGTEILCGMIKDIQKKFPQWTREQQLKGGISAYNAGPKNVQSYERMDIGTTKNDYANDVVARAKFYKRNGY